MLKSSLLVAMAVYTYLRLIVDHHGTAQLQALRQKEVGFCTALLRERVSATRRGLAPGRAPRVPCGEMGVARGRVCLHRSDT